MDKGHKGLADLQLWDTLHPTQKNNNIQINKKDKK